MGDVLRLGRRDRVWTTRGRVTERRLGDAPFALDSPATSWACVLRARRAAGDSRQRQRFRTNAMR